MVSLLADVSATPGGHEEKKTALMNGLCKLVGGNFWIWGLAADFDPEVPAIYTAMSTGGFTGEQMPKLLIALENDKLADAMRPLGREIKRNKSQVTRIADDYDQDNAFEIESVRRPWKEADIGPPLVCYRPVANNCLSGIGIYRRYDAPPFNRREAKIAHIVMGEVAWLHEQGWPWESALKVPHLPRRCRLALNLLLESLPRKQIADRMEISRHTVDDYVKHIYEFYGVHSHAELRWCK